LERSPAGVSIHGGRCDLSAASTRAGPTRRISRRRGRSPLSLAGAQAVARPVRGQYAKGQQRSGRLLRRASPPHYESHCQRPTTRRCPVSGRECHVSPARCGAVRHEWGTRAERYPGVTCNGAAGPRMLSGRCAVQSGRPYLAPEVAVNLLDGGGGLRRSVPPWVAAPLIAARSCPGLRSQPWTRCPSPAT
jgi:hypothetical protein